ncbi:MAG: c-type cytochrome [Magnetococcales bacterium]|nr:c-type cytochrome [Magnetococcales bacterium]
MPTTKASLVKPIAFGMLIAALGTLAGLTLWRMQGDVAIGKRLVENHCAVCHDLTAGMKNQRGPYLWGLLDRPAGAVPGFEYSKAFKERVAHEPFDWTEQNLDKFLANPAGLIPDVSMAQRKTPHQLAFDGIEVRGDRRDLITYLKTLR